MIPTLRRSRDDVFLIGEESILAAQEVDPQSDPTTPIEALGGRPSRRPRSAHSLGSLHGARGLALAGLGAGAALLLAALELGGGKDPARPTPTSSPRSPLISRSTARVPATPKPRVHPVARPAEVHRPHVIHHHRSRPAEHPASVRPPVTQEEPEREPTEQVAPVSSTAVTETESTPAPAVAPAATTGSTPSPGPPPSSSSGGGPAGVESFGFER